MKNKLNLFLIGIVAFVAVIGCANSNSNISTAKPVSFSATPNSANYTQITNTQPTPTRRRKKDKTKTKPTASPDDLSEFITPKPKDDGMYHLGPRGGCYTYTSGGNKRYVDRSLCH